MLKGNICYNAGAIKVFRNKDDQDNKARFGSESLFVIFHIMHIKV